MTFRRFATVAALTIAGLLAAVGIGLLANSISGDNVGLSAEPLSAGETLAPSTDDRAKAAGEAARGRTRSAPASAARPPAGARSARPRARTTTTEAPTPVAPPPTTTFDDHGGEDRQQRQGQQRKRRRRQLALRRLRRRLTARPGGAV